MDFMQLVRNMQGSQQQSYGAPNGLNNILKVLGIEGVGQTSELPAIGGGNGGGIVATPEQEAMSEELARRFGVPGVENTQYDDILVQGNRGPVAQGEAPELDPNAYATPAPVSLENDDWVEEGIAWEKSRPKRSGMFGMKGTLREVLGTLGDAFLVQSGNKPVYAPRKEQERNMDAMAGFTASPLAAVERLVAAGRTEEAAELYDDIQQNKVRTAQMESLKASREDQAMTRGQARFDKARLYTSALLNAAGDDPERVSYALQQAERAATAAGTTLEELGIEQGMTPAQRQVYATAGMNTYQQEGLERRDRSLDQGDRRIDISEDQGNRRIAIAQQNAETARQRMLKSGSSGSRPRSDTELEYFRALEAIPPSQRSAEQNAWVRKYTGQNTGTSRSTRRQVNPPGAASNRPRIVNVRDK